MNGFNAIERRLLNDFQQAFPLVRRPYREVAASLGAEEAEVIAQFGRLMEQGAISRIGPVFRPGSIGVSTLAAFAVAPQHLEAAAKLVSAHPEVNHNYEREHPINLWFVVTAPARPRLDAVLAEIAGEVGAVPLVLPMLQSFHIDLGFDLAAPHGNRDGAGGNGMASKVELDAVQATLVAAVQDGIALVPEPFAALGGKTGLDERDVLQRLAGWRDAGVIKRFGVVVRHHELGYRENAMAVWDVPDDQAGMLGERLARQCGVTLCYLRSRQAPAWPYNLYCMVHGSERGAVQQQLGQICRDSGLEHYPGQVLFSRRRFKQCGARYAGGGHGRA